MLKNIVVIIKEAKGILESTADESISVDLDLMFVSDEVRTPSITKRFGVCVPTNERQMVTLMVFILEIMTVIIISMRMKLEVIY